jgi:hypothetical protein
VHCPPIYAIDALQPPGLDWRRDTFMGHDLQITGELLLPVFAGGLSLPLLAWPL